MRCCERVSKREASTHRFFSNRGKFKPRQASPTRSSRHSGAPAAPWVHNARRCPRQERSSTAPPTSPEIRLRPGNCCPPGPIGRRPSRRSGLQAKPARRKMLDTFLSTRLTSYVEARDELGQSATSRLSPHLHFGEISPTQIWAALDPDANGADKFLAEIGWREFSHHLLFHWPSLPEANWRKQFDAFPWRDGPTDSRPGGVAAQATRWWTPQCASSGKRATCTTAPA